MHYNDGPAMDDNLKITKCPRCENEVFDEDAEFCQICGLPLYNTCVSAELHDEDGNFIGYGPEHKNKGNARYCKYCGAKTVYFTHGILKDYKKVLNEKKNQGFDNIPF